MTTGQLELHGRVWLTLNGKSSIGRGRIELLRQISETGSISRAAKNMRMSYKAAWDAVDAMNNALGTPVVESAKGGTRGGGSCLTEAGTHLIHTFDALETRHREWMAEQAHGLKLF